MAGRRISSAARATVAILVLLSLPQASTAAGDDPNDSPDAGVDGAAPEEAAPRPEIATLLEAARRIEDLAGGRLALEVDPASLFDVALDDEAALRVEAERLRSVIERGGVPWPVDAGVGDAGPEVAPPDTELYAARIALDRARLGFYSMTRAERDVAFSRHEERRRLDEQARAAAEINDAERKAREAEEAHRAAVEAAREARSEAERLVAEEAARLLGVACEQARFETDLVKARQALDKRTETALGLSREVRDLVETESSPAAADSLYDRLRAHLRFSRDALADAISARMSASAVPDDSGHQLSALPVDVDFRNADRARASVAATAARLRERERELRADAVSRLYDEVRTLNSDRLALLLKLGEEKRAAIIGFTFAGLDQAAAELRQVTLVLRYDLAAALAWLEALRDSNGGGGKAVATTAFVALEWLIAVVAFLWWRRRAAAVIDNWRARLSEEESRERVAEPGRLLRFLGFAQRTHRPFEWLLLAWVLGWLLPAEVRGQLEVSLLTTIFSWILGGRLAVAAIDALAGDTANAVSSRAPDRTAGLRLRSLRLAGRTIVVFGVILSCSSLLVGKGTIYSWVFSICWFAAIPVVLVIVRWWRGVIFERIEAGRRKTAFERWVVSSTSGWKSFPAAVAAGAYLFVKGGAHVVRGWAGGFDLTRRILAYLFRRDMDRLAETGGGSSLGPLPDELFRALGPEIPSGEFIPGSAAEQLDEVVERINRVGGGLFAVVGERGRGKTTVLHRVREKGRDVVLVDCPATGLDGLRLTLAAGVGLGPEATLEECAARMDAADRDAGLLIDHAHRLIHPVMGGLAEFDRLVRAARENSAHCTWFFAMNEAIWRFVERARGARPLFDEVIKLDPWREEEIARLLKARCLQAGLEPRFDALVEGLPADADEEDRAEAIERVASGYYRLIWDFSSGNPGVALHTWRRSLGQDGSGTVRVKLFQVPDTRELEQLPDPAVFVLRAVVQLEPALPGDIARATMLRADQVEDTLRYGLARGYFERAEDRYRVTWGWFRTVTRFLQRRHLLASYR